jgi:molybdenum cofactor cytidylyltransferase
MRATVEAGLFHLEAHFLPRPEDAWLLVPADHPMLNAEIVRQLLQARTQHPERSIFVPTYLGRRGHPTLIGWRHAAALRALPAGVGFNVYFRDTAADTKEVTADSAEVLADLDTPEDYRRIVS